MTLHHGDCLEVMAGMEPESVDAIVTDPPYGLEFMGKEWDRIGTGRKGNPFDPQSQHLAQMEGARDKRSHNAGGTWYGSRNASAPSSYAPQKMPKCGKCGKWKYNGSKTAQCSCAEPVWVVDTWTYPRKMQTWHEEWARAAFRVAKPSAYLLAFGGTRTVHRMTVALEDAGWIIRDMLVWAYASGFPKSKASLKPAWEPVVMARKPGPLRMLAIDECRIGFASDEDRDGAAALQSLRTKHPGGAPTYGGGKGMPPPTELGVNTAGRWPANVILTDPIFDGGWDGVVGGGGQTTHPGTMRTDATPSGFMGDTVRLAGTVLSQADSGTYSRFFLIPKADRADREPVLGGLPVDRDMNGSPVRNARCGKCGLVKFAAIHCVCAQPEWGPSSTGRANHHPTVKPVDLMRHLVRLVTPTGGTVLDPFLGSGTTAIAAEMEGFPWIGIEKEAEYVAIAEARLNGTQRGLGLPA